MNTCILCNRNEIEDVKSDHIRECYIISQDGKFDDGMFKPNLTYDELSKLKRVSNHICSNRGNCRKRQNVKHKGESNQ